MQQIGFYFRTYYSLNMFRAPLCPSSGAQRFIQMVAACGTWRFGLQVVGLVWSCGLCVRFAGCFSTGLPVKKHPANRTHNQSAKYHRQQPSV